MALRDVRVLARTGLTIIADVYDASDQLLTSVTMTEVLNTGVYLASLSEAVGHWLHAHSTQGVFNVIVGLSPAVAAPAFVAGQQVQAGNWVMEGTQMVLYAPDGATVVSRFQLLDHQGLPTRDPTLAWTRVAV